LANDPEEDRDLARVEVRPAEDRADVVVDPVRVVGVEKSRFQQ
jgi:hypothetical protein